MRLPDLLERLALVAANRGVLDVDWIRREWEAIFPIDDPPLALAGAAGCRRHLSAALLRPP